VRQRDRREEVLLAAPPHDIELIHMIGEGKMKDGGIAQTPACKFYSFVV